MPASTRDRQSLPLVDHQPLIAPTISRSPRRSTARGVSVSRFRGPRIDPYAVLDAPPIVLRSTWDYHRVPTMFRAWLQSLDGFRAHACGTRRQSRAATSTRSICRQLETAGSRFPRRGGSIASTTTRSSSALAEEGWDRAVLKPRIAATAYGTFLIARGVSAVGRRSRAGAVVGRAAAGIGAGDRGARRDLDRLLPAARSATPCRSARRTANFACSRISAGRVEPHAPSPALLSFADRVMTHVPGDTLYARVDVVETRPRSAADGARTDRAGAVFPDRPRRRRQNGRCDSATPVTCALTRATRTTRDRPGAISWSVSGAQREEARKISAWSRRKSEPTRTSFTDNLAASVRGEAETELRVDSCAERTRKLMVPARARQ